MLVSTDMPLYLTDTHALYTLSGFQLTSLTPQIVLRIQALAALPDIHDRLIVAEAIANGLPLITQDQTLTASSLAPAVW